MVGDEALLLVDAHVNTGFLGGRRGRGRKVRFAVDENRETRAAHDDVGNNLVGETVIIAPGDYPRELGRPVVDEDAVRAVSLHPYGASEE
jgi:hypothetical protein